MFKYDQMIKKSTVYTIEIFKNALFFFFVFFFCLSGRCLGLKQPGEGWPAVRLQRPFVLCLGSKLKF